jgi:hypothetical protein
VAAIVVFVSLSLPRPAPYFHTPPLHGWTPERIRSGSSGPETLTARRVVGDCRYNELPYCVFTTRGHRKARGPFPGYFRAGATYDPSPPANGWSFHEVFTTISGPSKIKGAISASGSGHGPPVPSVHEYTTSSGYSGEVKIWSIEPHFRETFYGM